MNFLVPAILAGLAALAVPVLMHLRHREKGKPVVFPSLMFLEQLPIRTASRQRINDWPLLLIRAIALSLIVFAFARPFFSSAENTGVSESPSATVIALDRSMSMGHGNTWAAAIDSVKSIVRTLDNEERVALIVFDEEAEVILPLTYDNSSIDNLLEKLEPQPRSTRYSSALRTSRSVLLDAPGVPARIVVVTDLQNGAMNGLSGVEIPSRISIQAIDVGYSDRGNNSIASVEVRRITDSDRTRLAVQARIISRNMPDAQQIRARLEIDGRQSSEQSISLPANGERIVAFNDIPLPSGRINGMITIDNDLLAADDTFHFALAGEEQLKVLLLTDSPVSETQFVEKALAIGRSPSISIERSRPNSLSQGIPSETGLVIVWDTPLSEQSEKNLHKFVEDGGGLITIASRRLADLNNNLSLGSASIKGTADRFYDRGATLNEFRRDHPMFITFKETPSVFSSARFLRYPRTEANTGSEVIARFDDGVPAMIEKLLGSGRILTVTIPLDTRTGDFPLQPAFLPLMRRMVLYASGYASAPLWLNTGQAWELPSEILDPVVTLPSGEFIRPVPSDSIGQVISLHERGHYSAWAGSVSGRAQASVAVNIPYSESDLTKADARELLVGLQITESDPDSLSYKATISEQENRQGLWKWLIGLALFILAVETVLSSMGLRAQARHGIQSRISERTQ